MRLQRVAKSFDNPDYVFELKRDGFRAIAYIEDHKCKLVSGNQNHFNFLFLTVALGKLPVEKAILDGEVICLVLWKSTAQGIEVLHNLFAQVVFLQMR
jgi:bifunctional non-homologous end joining protein LigD